MESSKKNRSACSRCVYAVKHYFTLGNKFFFRKVSDCGRLPKRTADKPFEEKGKCLFYAPDRLSSCDGDTEQYMFYLARRLDRIEDMLRDVIGAVYPDKNDDNLLKRIDNSTDE